MDLRVHRALWPALLAAALLLLLGWHAVPARAASVDPELVAESVSEDGYYVDSSASYLKSDADLDKLRAAIEGAGRAGVVVLPAGVSTAPVITRLLHEPNRRATYLVLSGTRLQAVSNNMSGAKVNGLLAKARQAGNPRSEVLSFLSLMSGKHPVSGGAKQKTGNVPTTAATEDGSTSDPSAAPVSAADKDSGGGNGLLYGIGGVAIVLILGGAGLLVRRRRKQGTPPAPGPGPGPGGPGPGGPGPGPGPGPAPGPQEPPAV
jgi:hypothetical protein